MITLVLLLIATFCATALVSGNNLSACVGTAIGSRIISRRLGLALGILGFELGLVVQGPGMVRTAHLLLPAKIEAVSINIPIEILFATVLVFLLGKSLRVPLSVTMSLVGLLLGVSAAHNLAVDTPLAELIIGSWFIAPLLAISAAFYSVRMLGKNAQPKNVWRRIKTYKILLVMMSFLSAYVLGTNSLALVVAIGGFSYVNIGIAMLGILFGSLFLGTGLIKRVGQDFFSLRYSNALAVLIISTVLFETATLFGIPLSSTQTTSSGVFGTGLSYHARYISLKPFVLILLGWFVAPVLSFAIGYFLI